MSLDVAELLLDESDAQPSAASAAEAGEPRRGRGRPRGSKTRSQGSHTGAGTGGGASPRVSGARELAQLLSKLIGGASVLAAMFLETPELAMTAPEANDIAKPAARLLAKSSAAARLVALAGKSSDYVELTFAVAAYGLRIWPVLVLRQQQIELQRQAQKGRPYGVGHTPEDAGVWAAQPQQAAARPSATTNAGQPDSDAATARAAADAAQFGGLGFANPDALAAGAYGDVAATIRAVASH